MALGYKQMAAVLDAKLTDEEFVRLSELLEGDAEYQLDEEIDALLVKTHPEVFTREAVAALELLAAEEK
jgi:hypothetical protein